MSKIINTQNAPAAIGPYSQALVTGNLVFTSGQIPLDPTTGNVVEGAITGQAEQVMKNLEAVLKEAGASFESAVKTTCFLADMADFAAFNEVYAKYFSSHSPARSCVAARQLPRSVMVEIEAVAKVLQE